MIPTNPIASATDALTKARADLCTRYQRLGYALCPTCGKIEREQDPIRTAAFAEIEALSPGMGELLCTCSIIPSDLSALAALEARLDAVRYRLQGLEHPTTDGRAGGNRANADSDFAAEHEQAEEAARTIEHFLLEERALVAAIERARLGEASVCADCAEVIPAARRRAVPTAIRCISCEHAHEVELALGALA